MTICLLQLVWLKKEQIPEHEEMELTYAEWFRRYVSDW